jgi:hypothetical protein
LQSLQNHYEAITPKPEDQQRHTIGSQTGPLEPSAPPAARRKGFPVFHPGAAGITAVCEG